MTIKFVVPWLALGHGTFNTLLMLLFFYQGWLGHVIRRERKAGAPAPLAAVRRHRKNGPLLAVLGMIGFCAGVFTVLLDKGRLVEYPLHLLTGLAIVLCLGTTYSISRRIKAAHPAFRTSHRVIGILIFCFYPIQLILGLGILL